MSRVYRCNRCGTVFTQQTSYSMFKYGKPKTSTTPAVAGQYIDLCSSCTTLFENFLHPSVTQEGSGISE